MKQWNRNPLGRIRRALTLGLMIVVASACRDDAPLTPTVKLPASIEVEPGQLQIASLSDTVSVTARVLDASGQAIEGVALIWTLEGEPTLEVLEAASATSRWRAVANGRSTLRVAVDPQAGYGNASLNTSLDVQVRQVPTLLELPSERIELWSLGETRVLEATARDARQNPIEFLTDSIVWRVDNAEVVRLDAGGAARGVGRWPDDADRRARRARAECGRHGRERHCGGGLLQRSRHASGERLPRHPTAVPGATRLAHSVRLEAIVCDETVA